MKKIVSLLLATVFAAGCLFGLTACNADNNVIDTGESETKMPETEIPETEAPNNDDIDGFILRDSIVAETEDFKVNAAMMAFILNANISSYSSYLSLLGVDLTVSLKEQSCPLMADAGATWYDYFMETTKSQITELLVFAQGAKDAGVELTAEEQEYLDYIADSIAAEAQAYGFSDVEEYLFAVTGNSVKLSDVRDCYELNTIGSKYYTYLIDSVEPTAEEREAYYADNTDSFNYIDVYKYSILASDFDEYDAAEQSALAKAYAETLAEINDVEAFKTALRAEIDKVTVQRDNETEEQFVERKEALFASVYSEFIPVSDLGTELMEWAKSAQVGDTYVEGVEGATTYTVYMLAKTPYRNEKATRSIRHILFSNDKYADDAKAREVLAAFVEAGATEEVFASLAKGYSDDSSADIGGLYENVYEGQMVAEFENWMFAEDRKVGDYGIVESDYGWHLMFYPGEGDFATWEVMANTAIAYQVADDYYAEKSAAITFDQSAIDKIDA